ncbi:MAG TPA: ATPase [Chloroflexi bacterium]|nr:ATPase [Chloroflexota bacterium]
MDILHLVDRLEETVKKSRRFPFSALRLVDERRVWALIDQMRISVPDEVRRAQRINQEREHILGQARAEAERLVRRAKGRVEELTSEHAIAQAAEARAAALREKAEREAATLRAEADDYVFNVLCQLEEELRRALRVVENGLRKIETERAGKEKEAQP